MSKAFHLPLVLATGVVAASSAWAETTLERIRRTKEMTVATEAA